MLQEQRAACQYVTPSGIRFSAPEVQHGHRIVAKADIFNFGLLMFWVRIHKRLSIKNTLYIVIVQQTHHNYNFSWMVVTLFFVFLFCDFMYNFGGLVSDNNV